MLAFRVYQNPFARPLNLMLENPPMHPNNDDSCAATNRAYSRWLLILSFVIFTAIIGIDNKTTLLIICVPALIAKIVLLVLKSQNKRKSKSNHINSDQVNNGRVSFYSDR